jgi:hypothetical protein
VHYITARDQRDACSYVRISSSSEYGIHAKRASVLKEQQLTIAAAVTGLQVIASTECVAVGCWLSIVVSTPLPVRKCGYYVFMLAWTKEVPSVTTGLHAVQMVSAI